MDLIKTWERKSVLILPLRDCPTDQEWSSNLDNLIQTAAPFSDVTLYGGRESFIPRYKGKFKTVQYTSEDLRTEEALRASSIRKQVSRASSEDFRKGVIFALENQLGRTFNTVDIAVVKGKEVLMGKKPGETEWRFPGGFVDVEDESLEHAANRELQEETGLFCATCDLVYVCSSNIDCWRYQGTGDRILTTFFKANFEDCDGKPVAGDDLAEIAFVPIDKLNAWSINSDHMPLFEQLEMSLA